MLCRDKTMAACDGGQAGGARLWGHPLAYSGRGSAWISSVSAENVKAAQSTFAIVQSWGRGAQGRPELRPVSRDKIL